jgi:hypothetical protein
VVVGVPIGLAAGHWLWGGFASSLGVVPVVSVPVGPLALGLVALVAIGAALAPLPAMVAVDRAARSRRARD